MRPIELEFALELIWNIVPKPTIDRSTLNFVVPVYKNANSILITQQQAIKDKTINSIPACMKPQEMVTAHDKSPNAITQNFCKGIGPTG
ncbi:MAG: hypothetical protein EBT78_02010 [Betaproteobacteria bacterium]|nr:hypothetical protein [Betaproteobacteria bacterium]